MAASLENIFGREYKAIFDVNVSQTVKQTFERFAPDADASSILDRFGNRYNGEMPGVVFNESQNPESAWNQPIRADLVPNCISYAMQHDDALPGIMHFVNPNVPFDPQVITPASLVWLSSIHYFGIVTRLANHKKNDFMEQMKIICDDTLYPGIRKKLERSHPEFAAYTPQEGYKLVMTGEQKNVVKSIQSSLNKAKHPKYTPKTDANNGDYRCGVFVINDLQRTSVGPADPKDLRLKDWFNIRNQIGSYLLTGALSMQCDRVVDQLSEGHIFAGCNFTGVSQYDLQPGVKIALRNELQMNLFSGAFGERVIKSSKDIREQLRYLSNEGNDDQGYGYARSASLEDGIETISSRLSADLQHFRDNDLYGDKSYGILKDCLTQKPESKKKSYKVKEEVIDMSKTNFLNEFMTNPKTRDAFRKMIRTT